MTDITSESDSDSDDHCRCYRYKQEIKELEDHIEQLKKDNVGIGIGYDIYYDYDISWKVHTIPWYSCNSCNHYNDKPTIRELTETIKRLEKNNNLYIKHWINCDRCNKKYRTPCPEDDKESGGDDEEGEKRCVYCDTVSCSKCIDTFTKCNICQKYWCNNKRCQESIKNYMDDDCKAICEDCGWRWSKIPSG